MVRPACWQDRMGAFSTMTLSQGPLAAYHFIHRNETPGQGERFPRRRGKHTGEVRKAHLARQSWCEKRCEGVKESACYFFFPFRSRGKDRSGGTSFPSPPRLFGGPIG